MQEDTVKMKANYYQEAAEWRYQNYESLKVWLNRSIVGLVILCALLGLSLSANIFLFPLKQTVPFLYTLNETTGEITQLGEVMPGKFSQQWLMTRFLLIRYVVNRESYDADNLDEPYQIAWAMSDTPIAQAYANEVRTTNAQSPFALYGKNKYVTVHVLAVNQLNEDTAIVRFEEVLHDRAEDSQQTIQKETIIRWKYTQPTATIRMLDRDPLGFKVTYYQTTQVNM